MNGPSSTIIRPDTDEVNEIRQNVEFKKMYLAIDNATGKVVRYEENTPIARSSALDLRDELRATYGNKRFTLLPPLS